MHGTAMRTEARLSQKGRERGLWEATPKTALQQKTRKQERADERGIRRTLQNLLNKVPQKHNACYLVAFVGVCIETSEHR